MKRYAVRILPEAEAPLAEQAAYIAADNPTAAARWLENIWDQVEKLATLPKRNPVAEMESLALDMEIRRLIVGINCSTIASTRSEASSKSCAFVMGRGDRVERRMNRRCDEAQSGKTFTQEVCRRYAIAVVPIAVNIVEDLQI